MTHADQFFDRAAHEARRYGEDPFVFLRELVQNSRDAGASLIEARLECDETEERLIFRDNGHGMDAADFSRYFLRLYASSKEQDERSVGFFGVGFWSVLLFTPDRIEVVSTRHGATNGIVVDCRARRAEVMAEPPAEPGTTITLTRAAKTDPGTLRKTIRERLSYYAAHVRPARGVDRLELMFEGAVLSRPLPVPPDHGEHFQTARFDGTLGFGPEPRVCLYQGGILIRDLASLDELIPSREHPSRRWGLFPIVHLNINGLTVLMDRQKVYEDPLLHEAVATCEKRLLRMHRALVRGLFPMNARNRLRGLLTQLHGVRTWLVAGLALVLLALAGLTLVPRGEQGPPSGGLLVSPTERTQTLDNALRNWRGSIIDSLAGTNFSWDFRYSPTNRDHLFRMGTFAVFAPDRGFFPMGDGDTVSRYPALQARDEAQVRISFGVSGDADLVLPLPPGYTLLVDSLEGFPGEEVLQNRYGEPFVRIRNAADGRTLTYAAIARPRSLQMPPMQGATDLVWDDTQRTLIAEMKGLPTGSAVARARDYINGNYAYANDDATARIFRNAPGTWLERVRATGAGDCDILNGLLVLLLHASDHKAFLSVGLVGEQGAVKATLHAWARYYDNGWRSIDLTRHANATPRPEPPDLAGDPGVRPPADTEVLPNPDPAEEVATETRSLAWIPLLLLPIPLFILIRWYRQREKPIIGDRDSFIIDLFRHYFYHGVGDDRLMLRFRPVFPLIDGSRLSLFEVQKLAEQGTLIGAGRQNRLLTRLEKGTPVLDTGTPIVSELQRFLPTITDLDDFETILEDHRLHPALHTATRILGELDAGLRVFQVPGGTLFEEAELPLQDPRLGTRQVLIGDRHSTFRHLLESSGSDPDDAVFEAVRLVLEHTTFYLNEKDAFLENLACRPAGWARKVAS